MTASLITSIATVAAGERAAAADIHQQSGADVGFTVLFSSSRYRLPELGRALQALGRDRIVAAATSRAIGRGGFLSDGITGFHLPVERFHVADELIESVARFGLPDARKITRSLRRRLEKQTQWRLAHQFGLLLVDAESRCEERLVAALSMELGNVPIVGGSAGDVFFNPLGRSREPRLLHSGRALHGAAIFCLIASQQPVLALTHHHFVPGKRQLVITSASPERRLVREIDGRKAVTAYAVAAGLRKPPKDVEDFSPFPLMIRVGGQYFARGMQRVYPDGSLEFACAMEPGLVVTVAKPVDMVKRLKEMFEHMRNSIGHPELVIGFDCAARASSWSGAG